MAFDQYIGAMGGESKGLVKKYRGGGWAGAFGNVVGKKHMTHPLPLAQK